MRRGMTTGWGTKVARAFSAASGAVLVAVLAGCSLGGSTLDGPEAAPSTSTPADTHSADGQPGPAPGDQPAFHFRSGDLVLGDFTYDDVAGNIFNPCEEISAEEFAAIGFETDGLAREKSVGEIHGCSITSSDSKPGMDQMVMGGSANIDDAARQSGLISTDVSEVIPNVYVYGPTGTKVDVCYAAVDTDRGQISIATGAVESAFSQHERCSQSILSLEKLYEL